MLATERYRGRGWGLLQVLEGMSGSGEGGAATREFADSAAAVLKDGSRILRLSGTSRAGCLAG